MSSSNSKTTHPSPGQAPSPPVADRRPHEIVSPHGTRIDEYYWLRDDTREDEEVLAYLAAENAYTEAILAPVKELENQLFDEIVGRIKQDDSSVPVFDDGYWYYARYETGKEYPIYARKKGQLSATEEIMLDCNELAAGHGFYKVGATRVSPDGKRLAYAEDTMGRRQFVIRFKDLESGQTLPDAVSSSSGAMAWASDSQTLLYVEKDPITLLPYLVKKHVVGSNAAEDEVIHEETDNAFYTSVARSKSKRYLYIIMGSTVSSEVRYAAADDPDLSFRVFLPRTRDHEYSVDHVGDRFVIRTNLEAKNFRIVECPVGREGDTGSWRDVIGHRDDAFVHDFELFDGFLAVSERSGGLRKIRIHPWSETDGDSSDAAGDGAAGGGADSFIESDEPAYATYLAYTPNMAGSVVRYLYSSLTTPVTTYDYDTRTGEKTLLKREPVLGEFDPERYVTEYIQAPARDGERIPVSLVYRKGTALDGTAPLYLGAYGSYGISRDPVFSSVRLSLLDRGVVYALAHIRGGQELGRRWYEDGKLLAKKNTFRDFIDVTEYLVTESYAAGDKVIASGGSAGGLLVGAVANWRPDLYRGIVAHVPFVDVVTTMLDESLPLTTGEFDEWGNPNDKEYYKYILSYSPYDNVIERDYPAMLVTTGLWDSQVQYFEPAKWVAKLRAHKTDANSLLLHTNMEAGHGGKSGRYQRYRELAMEYAFVLQILGMAG